MAGASRTWREAVEAAGPRRPDSARRAAPSNDDEASDAERRAAHDARAGAEWVLVEADESVRPARRSTTSRRVQLDLASEVREQLARATGGGARHERVERRLGEAAEHFENERFADAARILRKLVDEAPRVAAVRELFGITLYRQEKWKNAAKELEAYRQLSEGAAAVEQHPVLADCYRALQQWAQVEALWDELREVSPTAELVTEGRIVMAGSLADQGELRAAIRLIGQGFTFPKKPRPHHLRRAYVLADLCERAGDLPRARDLFARIEAADPQFADVRRRLRQMR